MPGRHRKRQTLGKLPAKNAKKRKGRKDAGGAWFYSPRLLHKRICHCYTNCFFRVMSDVFKRQVREVFKRLVREVFKGLVREDTHQGCGL